MTPQTLTVAQQLPINKLTDQLREAVAQVQYVKNLRSLQKAQELNTLSNDFDLS